MEGLLVRLFVIAPPTSMLFLAKHCQARGFEADSGFTDISINGASNGNLTDVPTEGKREGSKN
jgi:hypothetical protein